MSKSQQLIYVSINGTHFININGGKTIVQSGLKIRAFQYA